LDEVLLTVLVGLLCRMEDFDEIAMFGEEQLDWLRRFLPFRSGVAPAQTLRRVLRALEPKALAGAFSSWVASLEAKVSGVVAIDGKTQVKRVVDAIERPIPASSAAAGPSGWRAIGRRC
jgi:DDE_Tnp_1-associated